MEDCDSTMAASLEALAMAGADCNEVGIALESYGQEKTPPYLIVEDKDRSIDVEARMKDTKIKECLKLWAKMTAALVVYHARECDRHSQTHASK